MGNAMYRSRTRSETLDKNGTVVSTGYGAVVCDDVDVAYADYFETQLMSLDADGLIEFLCEANETAKEMVEVAVEIDIPLYVDDERYHGGGKNDDNEESDNAARSSLRRTRTSARMSVVVRRGCIEPSPIVNAAGD